MSSGPTVFLVCSIAIANPSSDKFFSYPGWWWCCWFVINKCYNAAAAAVTGNSSISLVADAAVAVVAATPFIDNEEDC